MEKMHSGERGLGIGKPSLETKTWTDRKKKRYWV